MVTEKVRVRLTPGQIADIRRMCTDKKITKKHLAELFGVSEDTIHNVLTNSNYGLKKVAIFGKPSKLTTTQVQEIRAAYGTGTATCSQLAQLYNVIPESISNIIANDTWYDPLYTPPSREEVQRRRKLFQKSKRLTSKVTTKTETITRENISAKPKENPTPKVTRLVIPVTLNTKGLPDEATTKQTYQALIATLKMNGLL